MFGPSRALKEVSECAGWQGIFGVMEMNDHSAAVRVAIDSLASFSPPVLKAI
jgi:hypothetical protein